MKGHTPFSPSLVDPAFSDPELVGLTASPCPAAPALPFPLQAAVSPAGLQQAITYPVPAAQPVFAWPPAPEQTLAAPPAAQQDLAAPLPLLHPGPEQSFVPFAGDQQTVARAPAAQQVALPPPPLPQVPAAPPVNYWQEFFAEPTHEEQPVAQSPGGAEWNPWQLNVLLLEVCGGKTYATIGRDIGRTSHACATRMLRLRNLERTGEWEELASYFDEERRIEFRRRSRQRRQQYRGDENPQPARRRRSGN
ncbi:hypothetical protein B0H67DRAFT_640330 [Lasiosphaeris hirsuta]|uniref:Uncharacterized protein n=1 Tax=Lasiosphaeris hirsuta TaxID=260670 RepID=A0AA40BD15_9PEZI|nr:hypothetical protein B0H67DRAFT_640330 [Lasiosphaeris hirsuta]